MKNKLDARCPVENHAASTKELPPNRRAFTEQLLGNPGNQPIPNLITTNNQIFLGDEKIVNGSITLGPDRPGCIPSGKGSEDNAFAIDLVVGRMGAKPMNVPVHPDFTTDASRVYISQKCDIDKYFHLKKGVLGSVDLSYNKSAVGIKADGVRIIAREGIRLVTEQNIYNSQGGFDASIQGIDLIAGGHAELLEPMVKGNKLKVALTKLVEHMGSLDGLLVQILATQIKFNQAVATHFHYDPLFGNPCLPSDMCMLYGQQTSIDFLQDSVASLANHRANVESFVSNYLSPSGGGVSGETYINSRWNFLN